MTLALLGVCLCRIQGQGEFLPLSCTMLSDVFGLCANSAMLVYIYVGSKPVLSVCTRTSVYPNRLGRK